MRKWIVLGAQVYVSEYRAPMDFERVWHFEKYSGIRRDKGVEGLYVMKGSVNA